jgi:cytoskeletal protein CcmA (bactofilin family)
MFKKTKKAEAAALTGTAPVKKSVPSIVSADLNILGNLVSEGLIDIDGVIEGNIKADQVTIRNNGKIRGDIAANVVHIYGEVQGVIRASSVFLYSSCRIEGIVVHQSLSVEDGAFIDGKLKRMQDRTALTPDALEMLNDDNDFGDSDSMPGSRSTIRLIS